MLAAIAGQTRRIALTSAVSVRSSYDPVRVYEDFATLDLLSGGRAELMVGRGSFTESFPLFGYDLADYDDLFTEKLDLLSAPARRRAGRLEKADSACCCVTNGSIPATERELPVWIAVGGTPESVIRAGLLGLPLALAIIGGEPARFAPLVQLYHRALEEGGHPRRPVAVHAHGYVAATERRAVDDFYPAYAVAMTKLGRERGWGPMNRHQFDAMRAPRGSLFVGTPEQVAAKIDATREVLGIERFMLHISVGTIEHHKVLDSIDLFGSDVAVLLGRREP